jgi:hypothetical protein
MGIIVTQVPGIHFLKCIEQGYAAERIGRLTERATNVHGYSLTIEICHRDYREKELFFKDSSVLCGYKDSGS